MAYTIEIKNGCSETFATGRKNVADVNVTGLRGEKLEDCQVELLMTKSAMLELGKELIRDALKEKRATVFHFDPAGVTAFGITQTLGVTVHPESIEPIIIDDVGKPIEEYIQEGSNEI